MSQNEWVKPRLLPSVITLVAVVTMTWLGVWQLERLAWKEGLIAQVEAAKQAVPLTTLPADDVLPTQEFMPVALTGRFDHARELHLAGRYFKSNVGFGIVTPFTLKDGRVVLVNRGWVPRGLKDPATRANTQPKGSVTIRGMIRRLPPHKRFTPDHNDAAQNMWLYLDRAQVEAALGQSIAPMMIDITGVAEDGVFPAPSEGIIKLRNDHLGYAITWFGVALSCAVIFVVYHRRSRREP